MIMKNNILLLALIFGSSIALQCDIPGCDNNDDGNIAMQKEVTGHN